jgi:hypothetical protein
MALLPADPPRALASLQHPPLPTNSHPHPPTRGTPLRPRRAAKGCVGARSLSGDRHASGGGLLHAHADDPRYPNS